MTLPLSQSAPRAPERVWHRRAAWMLRRVPWAGWVVQAVYRLWQPRFSVGVVGIVLDPTGERVLLVEHLFHPQRPWGLPGGWIARDEDPARTAEREIFEETGLHVRAVRPVLALRSPQLRRHLDLVYLCQPEDGPQPIRLSHELLGYRWAPLDALPPLVAFHERAIETLRAEHVGAKTQEQGG
ncbi:MAG: NUDIX hydrolase [Chloroflexota bacterium]